jgi:hypothetical protein
VNLMSQIRAYIGQRRELTPGSIWRRVSKTLVEKAVRRLMPAESIAPSLPSNTVGVAGRALFPVRFSTLGGVMQDVSFLRTID